MISMLISEGSRIGITQDKCNSKITKSRMRAMDKRIMG